MPQLLHEILVSLIRVLLIYPHRRVLSVGGAIHEIHPIFFTGNKAASVHDDASVALCLADRVALPDILKGLPHVLGRGVGDFRICGIGRVGGLTELRIRRISRRIGRWTDGVGKRTRGEQHAYGKRGDDKARRRLFIAEYPLYSPSDAIRAERKRACRGIGARRAARKPENNPPSPAG